jgi:aldehyde dehydrogenase (NAD+)
MTTESEKLPELELSLNFGFQRKKALELKIEPLIRRKERLVKLRDWILFNRFLIHEAMFADFAKHATEVDAIELFPVLSEIKHALKNLQSWIAPKEAATPLTMLGTRSYILCEPRGVCLIIAPWNYPFLLCAGPLVSALAAGKTNGCRGV